MKSGLTYWRCEGRHKKGPKTGQQRWVRYRWDARRTMAQFIRMSIDKIRDFKITRAINKMRISKHQNKLRPKRALRSHARRRV